MRVDPRYSVQSPDAILLGLDDWQDQNDWLAARSHLIKQLRDLLQIDRVVIYQFDSQFNGQVMAESRSDRLPALLGLHFPASDIPPQARALFLTTQHRLIVDVVARQKALLELDGSGVGNQQPTENVQYSPVDPCHLQYLLRMGVLSSITFSIHLQGKLWGLLVGHHSEPHHYLERTIQTAQLWVDQFTLTLAQVQAAQPKLTIRSNSKGSTRLPN